MAINKKNEMRPWGAFEQFVLNEKATVKLLTVKAGEVFSLQYHAHRTEFWRVINGPCRVTVGDREVVAQEGEEFTIPENTNHRIEGMEADALVLEISFGEFDEEDIVRVEDKYGRT